jgi:hypothetical protein
MCDDCDDYDDSLDDCSGIGLLKSAKYIAATALVPLFWCEVVFDNDRYVSLAPLTVLPPRVDFGAALAVWGGMAAVDQACAALVAALHFRAATARPGFRDMIDTIQWGDL